MDLAKSAMLVSVSIVNGGLLGERRDATATESIQKTFKLHERRAKASKYLIDRKHEKVKAVIAAAQRCREILYKYSMPWGDDKSRLLPVKVYEVFAKKMSDAEIELRDAWEEYLQVYPALIAASERELGGLFDRSQYPSVERARELFAFRLRYWPLPESGHFVAEIAQDAEKRAKADMSLEIETRLHEAAQTLVARGKETVSILVDRLESFKSKADGKIIRDSLVDNCKEMGDLIRAMNITGNRDIKKLAYDIGRLGHLTAESLRDDAFVRSTAIVRGKDILKRMVELETVDLEVSQMVAEAAEYDF